MKSFLTIAACLLTSVTVAFAQDDDRPVHHDLTGSEVIIGHGFLPSGQLRANGSERNSRLAHEVNQYTGAIFATYRYHINRRFSLGITAAFENEQGTYWDNSYNYNYQYYYVSGGFAPNYFDHHGTFTSSSFTIAPELTFNYGDFAHGLVRLYSTVGIGYTYRNEIVKEAMTNQEFRAPYIKALHANAYVSPLGVRFGRQFGGFFELGIGYKGILNYGVTYRF